MKKASGDTCGTPTLRPLAACLLAILAIGSPAAGLAGNNHIVTNCNDTGSGSLRDAIGNSFPTDTIDLTQLSCSTISLTTGAIATDVGDLTINGPGFAALSVDGSANDRVFVDTGSGTLKLYGLKVTNGASSANGGCVYAKGNLGLYESVISNCVAHPTATAGLGGAVYTKGNLSLTASQLRAGQARSDGADAKGGGAFVAGNLSSTYSAIGNNSASSSNVGSVGIGGGAVVLGNVTIESSAIFSNQAAQDAGLSIVGAAGHTASIINSTIAGNTASDVVAGIRTGTPLTLRNSTIASNHATTDVVSTGYNAAAGLQLAATTAALESTIIARNTFGKATAYDVAGHGTSSLSGHKNLIMASGLTVPAGTLSADPLLGSLNFNTTVPVLPLLAGSPAINAGNNVSGLPYDQRQNGHARVVGTFADIGAYEVQSTGVTTIVGNCADIGPGSLRDTIGAAHSGDTLDLGGLNCPKITLTSGALVVPLGNLTLLGPGAAALTIDGNLQDRVFNHTGFGTLSLSGMTMTRGYYLTAVPARGGCVVSASTLNLQNGIVKSCRVQGAGDIETYGGGLSAARLTVADSTISGNSAAAVTGNASYGGGLAASNYLNLARTTVGGNHVYGTNCAGGGIWAQKRALISSSTISDNQATVAAAMLMRGPISVFNSTISGNTASFAAGVVVVGAAFFYNSTITLNSSQSITPNTYASGLLIESATLQLQSTIVFGNTTNGNAIDIDVTLGHVTGANNLIGQSNGTALPLDTIHSDPLLGPLQDNGGPTFTHALPLGSPARDAGNDIADLANDQRGTGFRRFSGPAADIGAFEFQDTIFIDGFDGP